MIPRDEKCMMKLQVCSITNEAYQEKIKWEKASPDIPFSIGNMSQGDLATANSNGGNVFRVDSPRSENTCLPYD